MITPRLDTYSLYKAGYEHKPACVLCGSTKHLVIDHIKPLKQGGSNGLSNLRTLCNACNTREGWKYRARPKGLVKYTTHLKPTTNKAVKLLAVETDKKDYEIVEEALEAYLKKGGYTP